MFPKHVTDEGLEDCVQIEWGLCAALGSLAGLMVPLAAAASPAPGRVFDGNGPW